MAYMRISDFRSGIDTRRPAYAAEPGTLQECVNGVISRGGDIERRLPFVPMFQLPKGTHGLYGVGSRLYVFGSDPTIKAPAGVVYQFLQPAESFECTNVLDVDTFNGLPYVIASFADGSVHHYYDGVRVKDWETLADTDGDLPLLAEYFADQIDSHPEFIANAQGDTITIRAVDPSRVFNVSTETKGHGTATPLPSGASVSVVTTSGGPLNPAPAATAPPQSQMKVKNVQTFVAEVPPIGPVGAFKISGPYDWGHNLITAIKVNGENILARPIAWQHGMMSTFIGQTPAIDQTKYAGWYFQPMSTTVRLHAPDKTGLTYENAVIEVDLDPALTYTKVHDMQGGAGVVPVVPQIETVTFEGDFDAKDHFKIDIDGEEFVARGSTPAMATSIKTFQSKMYAAAGRKLRFSAIDQPTDWTTEKDGAGFIQFANQDSHSERLVGLEEYQGKLAVFARHAIQIQEVDPDPKLNRLINTLNNTGSTAARSIVNFGNSDVFYLSDSGIRSIRARSVTDSAYSADVGVAIDRTLIEYLQGLDEQTIHKAVATIEPTHGRYLIAINGKIFCYSFFPGSDIKAWTMWEPGFAVEMFALFDRVLYCRSGDTIYALGGLSGRDLPEEAGEIELKVTLPYLTGGRDATIKRLTGIDMAMKGEWHAKCLIDPNDESVATGEVLLHLITYGYGRVGMEAVTSHIAPALRCDSAGEVSLSNLAIHYEQGEES